MKLSATLLALAAGQVASNFVTLGDWGAPGLGANEEPRLSSVSDNLTDQQLVAEQLGKFAGAYNASFLLALGDNFYENGVNGVDDPQWNNTYTNVYTVRNHDYHQLQSPQAEIDFYKLHKDNRWVMPDFYYTKTFTLEDGETTVQILFIDTITLGYSSAMKIWKTHQDNAAAFHAKAQDQLQWIESELAASTADWLFVCGHFPVYSGGEHGDTQELLQDVLPLLEKYNVDAYMSGHDHTLQHLESNGVNYFVSGNGAKRGSYKPIKQSLFGKVDPGFMVHVIDAKQMTVMFVDEWGTQIYKTVVDRKRN